MTCPAYEQGPLLQSTCTVPIWCALAALAVAEDAHVALAVSDWFPAQGL
jgi:hypothetical protein